MSARGIQVVTTIVIALVALLNGTMGLNLNGPDVLGVVLAGIGLVVAIAHVEASHGHSLAQDWAAIKPELEALIAASGKAIADSPSDPAAPAAK